MARPDVEHSWTYKQLAEVVGVPPNTISQHVARGKLDPEDLASIAVYLAGYGPDDLRARIITAAISKPKPDDPGGWQAKKAAQGTTSKAKADSVKKSAGRPGRKSR